MHSKNLVQQEQNKDEQKKVKAVALLSGGLDSNLAIRIVRRQGIEVEAVAIKTPFCNYDCGKGCGHQVKEVASDIGVQLKTMYLGKDYLKMLKNPKYGYGSGMNPCVDCRVMMYKAAKDYMEKVGGQFLITGEVLFQRPMSQNSKALKIIEQDSGMTGQILRPLSAKNLPQSEAEKNSLVHREDLYAIKGRSRKEQIRLAKQFGISNPPNSAGGCLLTDPSFSNRVKDLYEHADGIPSLNDVELLKVGRHFRLSEDSKLIVGRNESENETIAALASDKDLVIEPKEYVGPTSILRGTNHSERLIEIASAIVLRYSDVPQHLESKVKILKGGNAYLEMRLTPHNKKQLEDLRI
jgi:tRNA-specific 2-thiouridylase